MKSFSWKLVTAVALFLLPGIASAADTTKTETKVVNDAGPFYFEETWIVTPTDPMANLRVIQFPKGKATLTSSEKKKLSDAVKSMRESGAVQEAYVAAYADELRPGKNDLSDPAQKLARQRGKVVRNYLEETLGVDTNSYNMATRPGWWARLFNTETAEVKEKDQVSRGWIADLLRNNGGASTASVVLVAKSEDRR